MNDLRPLVSILVPLHNKQQYVREAVWSALNQSYSNIEVLVIDDGSTDGSMDRLDKIRDRRLKVTSRANRGANATRNELIELAGGEYVQFLDADDLLDSTKIERQLEAFAAGVDAVLCGFRELSRDGSERIHDAPDPANLVADLAAAGVVTVVPLHRRQTLVDCGGFDATLPASQEYELHLRLALMGCWRRIVVVDGCLATWRRVDLSIASSDERVYRAKAQAIQRLVPLARDQQDRDALGLALMNAGRHLARLGAPEAPSAFRNATAISEASIKALPRRQEALKRFPNWLARWERFEARLRRM